MKEDLAGVKYSDVLNEVNTPTFIVLGKIGDSHKYYKMVSGEKQNKTRDRVIKGNHKSSRCDPATWLSLNNV